MANRSKNGRTDSTGKKISKTPTQRESFIEALSRSANIRASAAAAGISRDTAYRWKREDPEFSAAWDTALEDAIDTLEEEAWRRATAIEEPSDTLLIFLLKGNRKEKYRERHDVKTSGSVQVNLYMPEKDPLPELSGDQ